MRNRQLMLLETIGSVAYRIDAEVEGYRGRWPRGDIREVVVDIRKYTRDVEVALGALEALLREETPPEKEM